MKRRNRIWFYHLMLMGLVLILTNSCKKDENILKIDYGTLIDIDGTSYKTVKIGTQEWLAENLRTTQYNDATAIPLVTNNTEWSKLITSAYCWYNNDATSLKATYGALYNWHAVNTNKLCPPGWHVPTEAEWTVLMDYLKDDGSKLKEAGSAHWLSPNYATNETGFTALPGGCRFGLVYDYYDFYENKYVYGSLISGTFTGLQDSGYWWSSTESSDTTASIRYTGYYDQLLYSGPTEKRYGFSVRCLKDN